MGILGKFVDGGDEVAPSFSVTADDGALNSNTSAAAITYTPVNDAPVLNAADMTVSEGQTVTLSGAHFSVTDPDSTSFTFTVSSITGGFFQLSSAAGTPITTFNTADLTGGLVQFVDDGDEVAPSFSVTADDGALNSNTLATAITYSPINDAPALSNTNVTLTVAEDQGVPVGAVGTLVSALTAGVSDPDSGAVKGLAITSTDETRGTWYFSTDGGSTWALVGSVSPSASLPLASDAHTRLQFSPNANWNGNANAALTLRAWDQTSGTAGSRVDTWSSGGNTAFSSSTGFVDVTVLPINDDAPSITSNGGGARATVSVAENATAVTTVTATDTDLPTQTLSYAISGGADAVKFIIDMNTGTLSFIDAPDFESPADTDGDNVYDVTVEVSDGLFTDTQDITVNIAAVNDNGPLITHPVNAELAMAENSSQVAMLAATDEDLPVQTLSYTISGGEDAALFVINPTSGDLSFASAPDFETPADANGDGIYRIVLRVQDDQGESNVRELRIRVQDINEAPQLHLAPRVTLAPVLGVDDLVATAAAEDQDAHDTLSYRLIQDAEGRFRIDARTGEIRYTGSHAATDAGAATYTLIVEVSDSGGERRQQILELVAPGAEPADTSTPARSRSDESLDFGNNQPSVDSPAPDVGPTPSTPEGTSTATPARPESVLQAAFEDLADALTQRLRALLANLNADEGGRPLAGDQGRRWRADTDSVAWGAPAAAAALDTAGSWTAAAGWSADGSDFPSLAELMGRMWATGGRSSDLNRNDEDDALAPQAPRQTEPLGELILQITQPRHVASVALSVGVVWYITRASGMVASAMLGAPVWRQVDLLPIVAAPPKGAAGTDSEDDTEDEEALGELFDRQRQAR